jgi:mannose-6-phosphate isomerase-like protein (cupin superfamily)
MIERVEKPWGSETIWAHTKDYVGKILFVHAGESLSIQYHNQKDETMFVYSGTGKLNLYSMDEDGDPFIKESIDFTPGVSYNIVPKQIHNLEAITDMVVLEASTNHLNDLVRLKDKYNRG